jgi:hypothetical protein
LILGKKAGVAGVQVRSSGVQEFRSSGVAGVAGVAEVQELQAPEPMAPFESGTSEPIRNDGNHCSIL